MKGLKINKDECPLDSDGWSWEEYEATFNGKTVVVRVPIEIERRWDDVEIVEEVVFKAIPGITDKEGNLLDEEGV